MAEEYIAIQGVTDEGQRFRPSDWAERLAGIAASYDARQRLHFSSELRPAGCSGQRALWVAKRLQSVAPELWQQVMVFARSNGLQVREAAECTASA